MTFNEESVTNLEQPIKPTDKLIDKIVNYRKVNGKPFFSLEFFPPRNEGELTFYWTLLDKLRQGNPLFIDITWHSRSSFNPDDCLSSLNVASSVIERFSHETILHLTCTQYDVTTMETILNSAKSCGIKNILALRGDPPIPKENEAKEKEDFNQQVKGDSNVNLDEVKPDQQSTVTTTVVNQAPVTIQSTTISEPSIMNESVGQNGFSSALDLVKFIKAKFDNYFTLAVAGYPMGHPEAKSYTEDLNYLKAKVDAGADFIVTQLSFSAEQYITFIKDCRAIGIKVPIIPGIFPIQTQASMRNITKLTKVEPPEEVRKAVDSCKDKEAIAQYGLNQVVDLCKELINSDLDIPGLHFYTLNRDNCVTKSLEQLCLWKQSSNQIESTVEPQDINQLIFSPDVTCSTNIVVESIVS